MPYQPGQRLPGERASHIGHLEVLKSPLVQQLCQSFESISDTDPNIPGVQWQPMPAKAETLRKIFSIDGSMQCIESESPPYKALAFVKTALLRLDLHALEKLDPESPNPFSLRDILADSALYHSTVFPLRNVTIPGMNNYHAIRQIIYESIKDQQIDGQVLETLKWIVYEKWSGEGKQLPLFGCPHCGKEVATLDYDQEEGNCPSCHGHLFLTDMLGFHQSMAADAAPNSIATDYMGIHETLLLFTGIRYFWEKNRGLLPNCLFVKDGPLSIRAQYSKLVAPIRRFLSFAQSQRVPVHILSQEKTGTFADHLMLIGRSAPVGSIFIPDDTYIKERIQNRPNQGAPYGKDTNYGAKIFVKTSEYHQMVINIPTGDFIPNPTLSDIIGANKILSTIPTILSNRYEGALLPIELANGIASLSTYPSAKILQLFSESPNSTTQD